MARNSCLLLATALVLAGCGADTGVEDDPGITGPLAEPTTTSTTTSSTTTTSTLPGTTTTMAPSTTTTTATQATTTPDPGSQYVGITYSDASEIDLQKWGGWHIAEVGPGPSGWDSPYWGTRWQSGDDQMLWFEKETGNGSERVVLDVVTFLHPNPEDGMANSGCIADNDGVDFELHGVARHEGGNEWVLLMLWRADRAEEIWVELDPAGHVVEPATGTCELGAGDGGLP